jgi:hypothetical protein
MTLSICDTSKTLYIECNFVECHHAECRALCNVMLNAIMLSVIMLNVVAPPKMQANILAYFVEGSRAKQKSFMTMNPGAKVRTCGI